MLREDQIRDALLAIPNRGSEENSTRVICGVKVERTGEVRWMIVDDEDLVGGVLKYLDSAVARIVAIGT